MSGKENEDDYYRVLQVDRSASAEVIEKAYKTLAKTSHPDAGGVGPNPTATRRMQLLNEAYRVLRDSKLREDYDDKRRARAIDLFLEEGLLGLYRKRREFLR